MKAILIVLCLVISISGLCQTKANIPLTTDSVVRVEANDSTALFSVKDLMPIFEQLKKMPYETVAPFVAYLQNLVAVRSREWEAVQNASKNKK